MEIVNSLITKPRRVPLTYLVDYFIKTLQQWFYDRKRVAESISTPLTTWVEKIIYDKKDQAGRMNVHSVSKHKF